MRYSQQILSPVSLNVNRKTLEIVRASIRNFNISEINTLVMYICNVKMDITYNKSNMVRIDKAVEYCAIQQ